MNNSAHYPRRALPFPWTRFRTILSFTSLSKPVQQWYHPSLHMIVMCTDAITVVALFSQHNRRSTSFRHFPVTCWRQLFFLQATQAGALTYDSCLVLLTIISKQPVFENATSWRNNTGGRTEGVKGEQIEPLTLLVAHNCTPAIFSNIRERERMLATCMALCRITARRHVLLARKLKLSCL